MVGPAVPQAFGDVDAVDVDAGRRDDEEGRDCVGAGDGGDEVVGTDRELVFAVGEPEVDLARVVRVDAGEVVAGQAGAGVAGDFRRGGHGGAGLEAGEGHLVERAARGVFRGGAKQSTDISVIVTECKENEKELPW